jgi:multiple sugar transport system ATP-binding protein
VAAVSLRGVAKRFGDVSVIRSVDLDIADGEFVVLVGASGCGKSTLLRMIAGLESITAGDILIGERRVNDLEPRERDVAMVFQSYALYPHLDVRGNMSFSLRLRKRPRDAIDAQIGQTAGILDLAHLLGRFPRQLSGGQRQRVAMGRAIVRDPQVFLFDEPLSNLDAQLRIAMRTEIRALHQRLGATSIYVTHDQVEAMTMADRMVVMNAGRIEQVGAPLDVYDRPRTLFVAKFIGAPSINVVEGTMADARAGAAGGGEGADSSPPSAMRTRAGATIGVAPVASLTGIGGPPLRDGRVTAAFRPEHVELVERGRGMLDGTIDVVEHLGPQTYVFVGTADGQLCVVTERARGARVGDAVSLAMRPEHVHLFDAGTGARVGP